MLFPATTLVSDCCRAIIVMEGSEHQCTKCLKHCQRGGTLADLAAPQEERERLERDVIRCAKLWTTIKDGDLNATWSDRVALSANDLDDAVRKQIEFESQHLLKK